MFTLHRDKAGATHTREEGAPRQATGESTIRDIDTMDHTGSSNCGAKPGPGANRIYKRGITAILPGKSWAPVNEFGEILLELPFVNHEWIQGK